MWNKSRGRGTPLFSQGRVRKNSGGETLEYFFEGAPFPKNFHVFGGGVLVERLWRVQSESEAGPSFFSYDTNFSDLFLKFFFEFFFSQGEALKVHKLTHTDIYDYKCGICRKAFRQRSSLRQHMSHVHEGLRPYKCNRCDMSYSTKAYLIKHQVGNMYRIGCPTHGLS